MDERFHFADTPGKSSGKISHYILGSEIKVFTARNDPTSFEWGKSYEFPIGNSPFLISNKNHVQLTLQFEQIKKTDNKAEPFVDGHEDNYTLVDNLGSACIESVSMRQGLDTLETDAFVPKGRILYENFALAHAHDTVKDVYTFAPQDTAKQTYISTVDRDKGNKAWLKKYLQDGCSLHVAPFAWPFQYRNRSTAHEVAFPNTGQDLTIVITLTQSMRHLFASTKNTHDFVIKVIGLNLVMAMPRFSSDGIRAITNRKLSPLRYDGNFVTQYSQNIAGSPQDFHFSLQNIPMPHYMILQLFDPNYFTGQPTADYTALIDTPIKLVLSSLRIKFGNKNLNFETANFNVGTPGSELLRQEIIKTSNVFDNKLNNPKYFASNSRTYTKHHILVSFCSDEKNQTLLTPLDANSDPSEPQTLSVALIGTDRTKIPNGKLLVTLIYKNMHLQYNVATGTFLPRDLKSLVIGG